MADRIPYIRVFISSPGDVSAERKIALDVIDYFPNRPAYREKVAFRVVAWDKPGAGTAMLGTLTPQEAINRGLPKPSECDIVIVIFWSRMGTPFTDTDGTEYLSGTHWEMLDALDSNRPETIIFRRREKPKLEIGDPKPPSKLEQYQKVEDFFMSDLFYREDGSIVRGVNKYNTPDDFRRDFEIFFEELVVRLLERYQSGETSPPPETDISQDHAENITTFKADIWEGSPFPGLRAFTEADVPIFFGRGRETDALVRQLTDSRFVAVVGASGSGKSSLVGAGLIPRLKANGIEGSADWLYARFTPGTGKNPFEALMTALMDTVPSLAVDDPFDRDEKIEERAKRLHDKPERLPGIIDHALKGADEHVQLFLFIDQFEELFTLADATYAEPFAAMLAGVVALTPDPSPERSAGRGENARLRVVVTMRHDFYQSAVEIADLAELLRAGSFSLAAPRRDALRQMIERPAERAGLQLEAGLVERILDDTGDKSGNLALMAYALDELYKLSGDGHITHADYDTLGGVQGAIGTRAEQVYAALPGDDDDKVAWMQRVFHELVAVDERGTATRRRVPAGRIAEDDRERVAAFVEARLLTTDATDGTAVLEVAHEALFRSWERLRDWVSEAQEDLILLRQVRTAAAEWHEKKRPDFLLWPQERLTLVYAMIERLHPELNEVERDFIEPEAKRLLRELETLAQTADSHERRRDIGDRLAVIGDPRPGVGVREDGVPDMAWLPVAGSDGVYKFDFGQFEVKPFLIAKYQVTYIQFQAFMKAEDGFNDDCWWVGMPERYQKQGLGNQRTKIANAPRDSVSWYQSVAFARWMNTRFDGLELVHSDEVLVVGENAEIRLPTEWEWQWAAMNGSETREYPWGAWQEGYANTSEAGLSRSVAVGMYPHGVAECGALDMAGNLYDWCQNDKDEPSVVDGFGNGNSKVLRGGSFGFNQSRAAASYRDLYAPHAGSHDFGLRLVVAAPISAL